MHEEYKQQRKAEVASWAEAVASGDDLGAVIRSHLYLERELNHFNEACVDPAVLKVFKPRYHQKIRLAIALGLPKHFEAPLACIGDIRNTFAHELHPKLTEAQANRLFEALSDELKVEAQKALRTMVDSALGPHIQQSFSDLSPRDKFSVCMMPLWTNLVTCVYKVLIMRQKAERNVHLEPRKS